MVRRAVRRNLERYRLVEDFGCYSPYRALQTWFLGRSAPGLDLEYFIYRRFCDVVHVIGDRRHTDPYQNLQKLSLSEARSQKYADVLGG